jgi:hypothetical protein
MRFFQIFKSLPWLAQQFGKKHSKIGYAMGVRKGGQEGALAFPPPPLASQNSMFLTFSIENT